MKNTLHVLIIVAGLGAPQARAQLGQQMALLNSPAYEVTEAPLRNAPPRQYNSSKAVLNDVMHLMAEDAGTGFIGLPEGVNSGDNLVTLTLDASPVIALETLAKASGVSLLHDSGIWYGYTFKNRKQDRSRQHLMMLITPVALEAVEAGRVLVPVSAPTLLEAAPVAADASAAPAKAKPAAAPAPAEAEALLPETKKAVDGAPEDPRIAEIRTGADKLKSSLANVPEGEGKLSPDDGQLVLNVFEETKTLLEKVDAVRGDKSLPRQGALGDVWWELINLKTQAVKLSRRSPESLVVNLDEEGQP